MGWGRSKATACPESEDFPHRWEEPMERKTCNDTPIPKLLKCPNCTYETSFKARLDTHRGICRLERVAFVRQGQADAQKVYACDDCDMEFASRGEAKSHRMETHGIPQTTAGTN